VFLLWFFIVYVISCKEINACGVQKGSCEKMKDMQDYEYKLLRLLCDLV